MNPDSSPPPWRPPGAHPPGGGPPPHGAGYPQGAQGPQVPQGPQGPYGLPPQPPQPPRPGRYGTGLVAVLAVIAVLAGASFLGGGLAVGGRVTGLVAAVVDSEPSARTGDEQNREAPTGDPAPTAAPEPTREPMPTDEPSAEPTDEPSPGTENLISSEELIDELRRDFEIDARLDITDEVCGSDPGAEETALFQCTSSMDTNLVRVAAFESSGIAMIAAMAMLESEENTAADIQDACHFVLVWFEENGLDQQERDDMAEAAREIAGCP
ncbi:hypothetical protein KGD83_05980 [Nocardiopsis akebiae]|uniref:DUF732 domain-containing protein n=1 Tax=Nocardiopsis akebiae TaxID=2831968 RepID=A0ABX8C6Z5_9ACTN|nr:hypothetical protein [Nocardiopsis akebiae]QUX30093.1 hypothetical protein KGD83_05980 [Nocardiopsis akebiae]